MCSGTQELKRHLAWLLICIAYNSEVVEKIVIIPCTYFDFVVSRPSFRDDETQIPRHEYRHWYDISGHQEENALFLHFFCLFVVFGVLAEKVLQYD